jgi:hypothetical protein
MPMNRKKQKMTVKIEYQETVIPRKMALSSCPELEWLSVLIETPLKTPEDFLQCANALTSNIYGAPQKLSLYASIACSYLRACVNLLDSILGQVSHTRPSAILRNIQEDTQLYNTLTILWERIAAYSVIIHSSSIRCEEVEFHHVQTLAWICLARLTFILHGERIFEEEKKQCDFSFIDGHAFGIRNPLPCDISSNPICSFGLKEIDMSCSILASSFRLACTDSKEIRGVGINPAEVCEYIETLMCTYGSYLCFLPKHNPKEPGEFERIFNQAKFLDPMKERPSKEFIDGMRAMMHPLYAEKLINELIRKNSSAVYRGQTPTQAEFLSFFTWLIHLANSDMAKTLRTDIIKTFPDAFVNSSHIAIYRMRNSIGQKAGPQDLKSAQVLTSMTPSLFDEVLEIFKAPMATILKYYVQISAREEEKDNRSITLNNSMRIAAQHVIMELLNTAIKNVTAAPGLSTKIAMQNLRVIGGKKSTKRSTACGASIGDLYKLVKQAVDPDPRSPEIPSLPFVVESLGRFYLIGLPGRAIAEYKTLFDSIYGYFASLPAGSFKEIKNVISSAFSRYIKEEQDSDPGVIAHRNAILTLSVPEAPDIEDSDSNVDKTSSVLPSHRLGHLCNSPTDVKDDPTSAYIHLKRYTSAVSPDAASSAASADNVVIFYG